MCCAWLEIPLRADAKITPKRNDLRITVRQAEPKNAQLQVYKPHGEIR